MSDSRPQLEQPASAAPDSPGSRTPETLSTLLGLADAWAGGALALIVGGSHAAGADVWVTVDGRSFCLSDLDLYAVVADRAAQRRAMARARAARPGLRGRLLAVGLAAPLEVAFLVPGDLERLPARPGTLELARRGRVVRGDPAWLAKVPRWQPRDVSREEVLLLLENRAFEFLLAWPALSAGERLARLQGRHAVLKSALDVVRVQALLQGEYLEGAGAVLEWSTRAPRPAALAAAFPGVLEAALAWRAGRTRELEPEEARGEWRTAVSAWIATWQSQFGTSWAGVLRAARRARLRRRLRQALVWRPRSGRGPGPLARLLHATRGTPQHRVNAAAAVLLLSSESEAWSESGPRLSPGAARALAELGVVGARERADWTAAARAVVIAWDRWILDGQRTEEAP